MLRGVSRCLRHMSSKNSTELLAEYKAAKEFLTSRKFPPDVNPHGVFCNDLLHLSDISTYGFDYDYTLISYKQSVEILLHDAARSFLVSDYHYPREILDWKSYDPEFSIRGLHYDIESGYFMKVDSFHRIQLDTVYKGRTKVGKEKVLEIYPNRHLPLTAIENEVYSATSKARIVQMADIFAKPLMCLLADVIDLFEKNNMEYVSESVYDDVNKSISKAHAIFHSSIQKYPSRYLEPLPELFHYLQQLKNTGKQLFIITNSPYESLNAGLTFTLGEKWRDFFSVIVTLANKPFFFKNNSSYFREFDTAHKTMRWKNVATLSSNKIYAGGNLKQLQDLTGWQGNKILYFGDHPYSDLADLALHHGWRTAGIIRELEKEILLLNSEEVKHLIYWSSILRALIDTNQDHVSEKNDYVLTEWNKEFEFCNQRLKELWNPRFGSIFRTHQSPTSFSRRLFRFADIYTAKVTNLLLYSTTHSFSPSRGSLPHEFRHWTH